MPSRIKLDAVLAALLCCLVALSVGCRKRSAQAAPPPVDSGVALESAETPAEARPVEAAPEPAPAVAPASAKPAPARAAPPPPPPPPPRPPTPQLSPRLSPAEQDQYQRKTQEAIAVAERNLRATDGRRLNALQVDMTEKIRGFLAQAREAAGTADWLRAHNLAEKALVLSIELVNSL